MLSGLPTMSVNVQTESHEGLQDLNLQATEAPDSSSPINIFNFSEFESKQAGRHGMQLRRRHATLHSAGLIFFSIAAALALTFMVLRCYGALGVKHGGRPTARRLLGKSKKAETQEMLAQ